MDLYQEIPIHHRSKFINHDIKIANNYIVSRSARIAEIDMYIHMLDDDDKAGFMQTRLECLAIVEKMTARLNVLTAELARIQLSTNN